MLKVFVCFAFQLKIAQHKRWVRFNGKSQSAYEVMSLLQNKRNEESKPKTKGILYAWFMIAYCRITFFMLACVRNFHFDDFYRFRKRMVKMHGNQCPMQTRTKHRVLSPFFNAKIYYKYASNLRLITKTNTVWLFCVPNSLRNSSKHANIIRSTNPNSAFNSPVFVFFFAFFCYYFFLILCDFLPFWRSFLAKLWASNFWLSYKRRK